MVVNMAPSMSVSEFYAGKSIFITGATGFMGKVLIEKLLRCCPDVANIYVLMRQKKEQSVKERLEDFINCQIFDRVRDENRTNLAKLRLVSGDILQESLGISEQDAQELKTECQVIFHCAANVRFDQELKGAISINTAGTKKVLDLALEMEKLEVFLHVSTAYCHCEQEVLEEKVYPAPHDPRRVIELANWMEHDVMDLITPKMISPQPNTYAYTKNLTEDLVASQADRFPIVIARPSIVTAAWREPVPGWVENLNGPTGLLVGAGKGVIRSMHCEESYNADLIPVDIAINACILLACKTAIQKPKTVQVCNVTVSGVNPITWGEALESGRRHVAQYPFSVSLWYPGGSVKSSRIVHELAHALLHLLPAYVLDLLLRMLGRKPFMVKVQKRISGGLEVLQYYTTKQWLFKNENLLKLREGFSSSDAATFYTDMRKINWNLYIRDYILGAREFCCKDDPATLPQARRLLRKLYWLHVVTQLFACALVSWLIVRHSPALAWAAALLRAR